MSGNANVELIVLCDAEGLVQRVLLDVLGVCGPPPLRLEALTTDDCRPRAGAFLAELAGHATSHCELPIAGHALQLAGCAVLAGYCVIGGRASAVREQRDALAELTRIVNEQCNAMREAARQRAVERRASPAVAQELAEIARLNNELVAAQRELAQQNAKLKRTLTELEQARAVATEQRGEIERINVELTRSNEALQRFAFVAAHDLRAPLRSIRGFIELFDAQVGGQLDARPRVWLDHVVRGAQRMDRLISDTLAFARSGAVAGPMEAVDLNAIVDRQRVTFMDALARARGELTRADLPRVMGYALQLEQVIQNLVQNALVYRAATPPRIHVDAQRADAAWRVSVRDNGIGIAPEHREAVFEPLTRPAARSEHEGTGLGLAICRQIVRQHRGEIWIEPTADGCMVCFTLPDPAARA